MLQIKEEFKKLIPALSVEEFNQLEANCLAEGIREKIITWDGFIIDGHNRFEIATRWNLEYKSESKSFKDENEVKEWMIHNQFGRRNLSNYQRSVLALELESVFSARAKENQAVQFKGSSLTLKSAEVKPIETRKELAKIASVGHDTIAKVKVIEAKATPEVKAQLRTGEVSINQAYQEIKKEEKKIEREVVIKHTKEKIEKEEILKPSGNFSVIAIDPPWDYSEKGGTNNSNYDQDGNRGQVDYPTMTLEQIKNIELPAKEDSVIFLWTVHAFLEDAFELLRNWGFTYKATMVWDKEKMGMGRNIRLQCEFCLLATKGNPIIQGSATRDIMREPRRQHSRKPECFYELVETITIGNRLDYFSRENRNGWSVYGADLNKFTND